MKRIVIAALTGLVLLTSAVRADTWFTLADYRALMAKDVKTAELVLGAMREAVFYAQGSVGERVVCASPIPIAGSELRKMLETEIADPSNDRGRKYEDNDQVAFVFLHALKREKVCK